MRPRLSLCASLPFRRVHPCLFVTCIPASSSHTSPPSHRVHPHLLVACIHAFSPCAPTSFHHVHPSTPFHCVHPHLSLRAPTLIPSKSFSPCDTSRVCSRSTFPFDVPNVRSPRAPFFRRAARLLPGSSFPFDVPNVCSLRAPFLLTCRTFAPRELLPL